MAHAVNSTTRRLAYAPRHIACYALVAVAIPVVVGLFAFLAVLGTLALAGDFVRVGHRRRTVIRSTNTRQHRESDNGQ